MKRFQSTLFPGVCLALTLLASPAVAWAVENPKRTLLLFPAITVVILVIIIFVTRKR